MMSTQMMSWDFLVTFISSSGISDPVAMSYIQGNCAGCDSVSDVIMRIGKPEIK